MQVQWAAFGAATYEWQIASNWSSGAVPTSADDVSLTNVPPLAGTAAAMLQGAAGEINSLTLAHSTLSVGDGVAIGGTFDLTVLSGVAMSNDSAIYLYSSLSAGSISGGKIIAFGHQISGNLINTSLYLSGDVTNLYGTETNSDIYTSSAGTATTDLIIHTTQVGRIHGFKVGDILDLPGAQAASATYDGSNLTISELGGGVLHVQLSGELLGDVLTFKSDGQGGSQFSWEPPATGAAVTAVSGDWQDGSKWMSGAPPTASTDVVLNKSGFEANQSITIHSLSTNASSLFANAGLTVAQEIRLGASGYLKVTGALNAGAMSGGTVDLFGGVSHIASLSNTRFTAIGGATVVTGGITNSTILAGGGLEIGGAVTASAISAAGANLRLDDPTEVGPITNVTVGTTIDLVGISAKSAIWDGQTVTVEKVGGGMLTLSVTGPVDGQTVQFAPDNHGGTNLFWRPPAPVAPTGLVDAAIQNGFVKAAHDTAAQLLTGKAQVGVTVTVFDGAHQLGATTADGSGSWSFTLGVLADGAHSLTAKASDAFGQVGPTSANLAFTVDTHAPVPEVLYINRAGANWAVYGTTEANAQVALFDGDVQIGTATADGRGVWSIIVPLSTSALHSFGVVSLDEAGNIGSSTGAAQFSLASAHLIGGAGNDVLIGWGDDILTGGAGQDRFVVDADFTTQRIITDFTPATAGRPGDILELDAAAYHDFAWVMANASQHGPNTVITVHGASLTLQNVTLSSLHAGDFIFA
jgi:hypothetical protein